MQQTTNFATSFLIFRRNKVWYFVRTVCQQTILMKYALFVVLKSGKIWNCRLLQIIGGPLRAKNQVFFATFSLYMIINASLTFTHLAHKGQ